MGAKDCLLPSETVEAGSRNYANDGKHNICDHNVILSVSLI